MNDQGSKNLKPFLPPLPLEDSALKIVALETAIPNDVMSGLVLLRVHTENGLIGAGETYYLPHAVAAVLHDWMSHRLLGADALAIENHWRFFYERTANFGGHGAELRALSALDLALWDILGQTCNQPVYRLLGGPVRDKVRIYNSCGHPSYGRNPGGKQGWPGYGSLGEPGPLNDSYNLFHAPDQLAAELVAEGFSAMKVWCFDEAAHAHGGATISLAELNRSIAPLRKIREAVGDSLEIMVDGHGFFLLPAALRIAEALEEIRPLWLEDVLKTDSIATLADFRQRTRVPISVSEMLVRRDDYVNILNRQGADWIQIDPTWCGGISETHRLARLAEMHNVSVSTHDCTGPLTTLVGIHVNAAVAACGYQETVRAHVRTFYSDIIEPNLALANGYASLPTGSGLGATLNPELFDPKREGYRISRLA